MKINPEFVTELEDHQVFVFGSNSQGWHGGGAAGVAFWIPPLSQGDRVSRGTVGKWSIWGQGEGFQQGKEGMSYAIPTVTYPGKRGSIPLKDIYRSLLTLHSFSLLNPEFEFLITPLGEGFAGYTEEQMYRVWNFLNGKVRFPNNWTFVGKEWVFYGMEVNAHS